MKRLTLDETWKLCLSMWRWIAKMIREGSELFVSELKDQWLRDHGYEHEVWLTCFFCGYIHHPKRTCDTNCPARMIDRNFNCHNPDYDYQSKPIAFYNKIVSLNRKRLAKRKK